MPVNAVPQDITATSLQETRNFCLSYEFQGVKHYEHDVDPATSRLSDGIFYFMMESWMPTVADPPNPGTNEGWHQRRQLAESRLFDYMKRRVGDFPNPQ